MAGTGNIVPIGVCERYSNMPVCREFQYFIEDGRYRCSHPYWPMESLIDGGFDISQKEFDALCLERKALKDRGITDVMVNEPCCLCTMLNQYASR